MGVCMVFTDVFDNLCNISRCMVWNTCRRSKSTHSIPAVQYCSKYWNSIATSIREYSWNLVNVLNCALWVCQNGFRSLSIQIIGFKPFDAHDVADITAEVVDDEHSEIIVLWNMHLCHCTSCQRRCMRMCSTSQARFRATWNRKHSSELALTIASPTSAGSKRS